MYFSLITPEPGREREVARELISGPYGDHQWLWRLFPAPEGAAREFLFRRRDVEGIPRYYVLSRRAPQPQGSAWRVRTSVYAPKLSAGTRLQFDLRANPVVDQVHDGRRRRHDVVMQEKKRLLRGCGLKRWGDWTGADRPALQTLVQDACGAWLRSRAPRLGFEVDEDRFMADGYQQHRAKDGRIRFSTADLSGELTVVDPDAFVDTLGKGVGHAKAFGCGLLLVRRIG